MANYATTKAALDAAIRTNGVQAITGAVLNTILNDILAVLGKHYQFGGLVTPDTAFTAGDEKVAFFAVEAGTYTNFGGAVLDGKTLHILTYDSAWHDADTSIPSGAAFEAALALAIKGAQSGIAEGIADTISAGTAQEFLQRQSGGDGVNCIKRIKGKTIAWNQLFDPANTIVSDAGLSGEVTLVNNGDGSLTLTGTTTATRYFSITIAGLKGHRIFASVGVVNENIAIGDGTPGIVYGTASVVFASCDANTLYFYIKSGATLSSLKVWLRISDLTLLGLGDLTADQFRALYPAIYAYNAGVLKSNDAAALLTVGRNQWNEEWENKVWQADKTQYAASGYICSKNIMKALPGTTMYVKSPIDIHIIVWDASGRALTNGIIGKNVTYAFPINAYEWVFFSHYGNTYNNDICFNLSDASFNGTYEPYWQRVLALRLSELTGIPEGGTEADRVTMFPSGLRGLGTSYDEIAGGKATKRRGVRAYESGDESDASVITDGTNTDYALATPIVYTNLQYADGTPFTVPATILVDDHGTERIEAPEGAATPSAPFCCDSNYSIGVANLVKRLAALENAE